VLIYNASMPLNTLRDGLGDLGIMGTKYIVTIYPGVKTVMLRSNLF
jgi:hypothetical protein